MNCQDFLYGYSDYDDSLLGPAEHELFVAHLGQCPRCARYDRVLRKGRMLARQLPSTQPSQDFVPRLQQRLHHRRRERRRLTATPVLGGAASALAAVTVMLVVLWSVSLMELDRPVQEMVTTWPDEAAGATPGAARVAVPDRETGSTPAVWQGRVGTAGAWAALPATLPAAPTAEVSVAKGWAPARVDHRVPVAYSPLVTGPPAYRVAGAFQLNTSTSTSYTPD